MKLSTISLFFISTVIAGAQTFEGTVKWKTSMEFTDPELKGKVEEATKTLNDPAMQAQMAELKKQMENPQMKAMMESNPQMKAMMDKMTSGNTATGGMMPTGMTLKMKNGNTISIMEGGMMAGAEVLFDKGKNQSFRIDRQNKTYSVMTTSSNDQTSKPAVKVTKTSETVRILKYTCTKYIADVVQNGKSMTQTFWTTTEIKDWDIKSLANQKMGKGGNAMFYEGVEGVPLRVEISMPEGKMTMEVTEISNGSLSDADFVVPADYKEVKDMFSGKP